MGKKALPAGLADALFGKSRQALLALFYLHPERDYYLSELISMIGSGRGAVQREVEHLFQAGLISRSRRGHQVFYQADRRCPIFAELQGLMLKTAGLSEALLQALAPFASELDLALIYGSLAQGRIAADSDVDLLMVGKVDELKLHQAIRKAEARIGRSVNYTILSRGEFRRRKKEKGGFLSRILSGHKIILMGGLNEIR